METGFVKRIGDVIIQRVAPPLGSSMSPEPPAMDGDLPPDCPRTEMAENDVTHPMISTVEQPPMMHAGGESADPLPPDENAERDVHASHVHDEDVENESTPIVHGDIDDDIVPDFPEDDLNEDNVADDEDDVVPPDLSDPPITDEIEEGEDVLAGLKEGDGSGVALMESEDLLREIKPEPMEHDERDDEDPNDEAEERDDELEDDENKDEESSKRKQESDNEDEKMSKKKKSEEESELDKKKNAINFRRNIREVMDENQLDEATLAAQRQEAERLRRVQDQQKYLREMQIQRQLQINRNRTARMLSFLQGGSGSASIMKAGHGSSQMGGSSPSSKPNTVVVKLGSGGPPQLLNKKVLEAIRSGKSSPTPPDRGLNRMIHKPHMVTPSVSIAPVKPAAMSAADKKGHVTPDVVTISSSDDDDDDKPMVVSTPCDVKVKEEPLDIEDDDDDCIVISEPSDVEEEEEEVDTNNSGMHTNDLFNCPDEQGRVLINVGKQEGEQEIFLAPQVSRVIKPHQIGGVRFLFDNIIESAERYKTSTGFGCILAHSMGLGKTLQVVSFCDVFLRETPGRTVMCIMPINTLQNWMAEFNMWLPLDPSASPLAAQGEVRPRHFQIFVLNDLHKTIASRAKVVAEWQKEGGVLLIGYEMYRQLSLKKPGRARKGKKKNPDEDVDDVKNKPHLEHMQEALVKPGPDLVICDEGHRIKNSHASISHALKQIRTKRRVVLTGYPLQNNLLEYWCMVDFVRPNYLGTKTEFSNMFERPIQNGQCIDSTPQDIRLMRYRAHVLHSLLEGFVQRRSHSVLRNSLPQKEEYVLLVRMNTFQRKLYDTFMNEVVRTKAVPNPLKAFAVCCKIWNHPDILYNFLKKRELDELQDLDLEETANLNTKQTVDPNSPRRETRGKKGKGGKKAPPVPIKPAATVPPTTSQPEVKTEGQNTNFNFNRDNQQDFGGPPPSQGEGYNGPPAQGDFNNFNPNFREGNGSGYYQNYNAYPNFPQEGNYNYSGEYNNYNNYYQGGGGNYGNNFYPSVKKEPEEFASPDKKEEIKLSQPKGLSGGQVVYNSQFPPNQFEPKKEFPQFTEWNQFGQQNYGGGYSWQQDQQGGDQKPPKTNPEEMQTNYSQQSGFSQPNPSFPPHQNTNFSPQNFEEQQPASNAHNPQNSANFGSGPNFGGQPNTVPPSPGSGLAYQQPGFGSQSNPPPTNMPNKTGFGTGFDNQQNPLGSNPNPSGFTQNFGSAQSSNNQMNQQGFPQNFNQPPNAQGNSVQLNSQGSQNFGSQGAQSDPSQPNLPNFNSNYGNQPQCNNPGFPSQGLNNQPNNVSNTQSYQQGFPETANSNPNDSFQQSFGTQSGLPNSTTYGGPVSNIPNANQALPSNFPSNYMSGTPANPQHGQQNVPTSQPPSYSNSQPDPALGFSNFISGQPPCSSASQQYTQSTDVQNVYTSQTSGPNDFRDNRGHSQNFPQSVPSDSNAPHGMQGNQDFYRNFPIKNEPGAQSNPTNQEYPPNFQGSKPEDVPQQNLYTGQSSQGFFNSPPQPQNLFRPHQEQSQMDRFNNQPLQKQDSLSHNQSQQPAPEYNNENFTSGLENHPNPPPDQSNQMNDYRVNSQSPIKNQSDMNRYGAMPVKKQQDMGSYGSVGNSHHDRQHLDNYASIGKQPQGAVSNIGGFGMDSNKAFQDASTSSSYGPMSTKGAPNQTGQGTMGSFGSMGGNMPQEQPPVGGYGTGIKHGPTPDVSGYTQIGNKEPQMLGAFGASGTKGPQDQQSLSCGFGPGPMTGKNSQDSLMGGYSSASMGNKNVHDPSMSSSSGYGGGPIGSKKTSDPPLSGGYGPGPMGSKNTQESQMGGYAPLGPKIAHDPNMGGYSHGHQLGTKNPQEQGGVYGAGPVGSKSTQDSSSAYRSSSGSRDQSKIGGFKGTQEHHPNIASYGPPMGSGNPAGMNPYGSSPGKDQQDPGMNMGGNYGQMGAKSVPDSVGNYGQVAGRNPHESSGMQGFGNSGGMNHQDSAASMGNYGAFGLKNNQQDNRMGAFGHMGTQNQQEQQDSHSGTSKAHDPKNIGNFSGIGSKMQQESRGSGSYSGNNNTQQPPMHGFPYNQQDQASHIGYGNQSMDGNHSYRSSGDQMFPVTDHKNPMSTSLPPYGNQMPPSGSMMGPGGSQMNQSQQTGNQMQHGSQMHQTTNQMNMSSNLMNQRSNQMNTACNQMNMAGNQMNIHGNQMNQPGNSGYSNMNMQPNNQGTQGIGDGQSPYYQNQNYNFDQPGTSFSDMKEKRGMSCQTEFDKDDRAQDKDENDDGKKDDDSKKDDDKKAGESQIATPTGKGGKEDMGIPYDWATELLKGYTPGDIHASAKMTVFFCILEESIALGDRILVFSQSLFTLNLMEELLQRHDIPGRQEKWARNLNYFRLDGSTTAIEREKLINEFNSNPKLHLFLVSTRAGSLGINLVGANRVIVFDASWNPCHDTQAVCRVYRYGQKKPCFVYRLVTDNCLEKKIYDRQINKQGMSDRVVDECNPDAHLSIKEVTSLCWDDKADDTEVKDFTDIQDQYIDVVIQKVLQQHSKLLSKEPFQHESLLVDRKEKKLSQAEKRLAKRSYELEKQASTGTNRPLYQNSMVSNQGGIIRRGQDKPMASVRPMQSEMGSQLVRGENRPRGWIPASVWQRQGMSAQEMTLPLDVVIPTNAPDRSSIVLKAGQKVMVLKSPKGIYMQLENGKIIAIRTAFKPGNQGNKEGGGGPKKSTGTGPEPPRSRNVPVIPTNLRNNAAVSITPRGPSSSSGAGPGRSFSQGNRPVRAVGPTHRPSPVSVTVTKKRPVAFDVNHMAVNQMPTASRMGSKSDESDGCDSTSASPARPPPSPHHDSRDSMASSSSQFGGSYSNSSRSTPVLPSFARDVSITPYSSKDLRGAPGNSAGIGGGAPYRDPTGYMGPAPRTEVSITPFSREAMGVGQDMGRDESRKEYDGGGGPPPPPPSQLDYRSEPRPFASVSLDASHSYRHDPLGHGDGGGSRSGEPSLDTSVGERSKRAFQPYPSAYPPPPPPPLDKGASGGPSPYNPYHMGKVSGGYDDKGHGAGSMMRTPSHQHHGDSSKHQAPHPLYHHRPPPPPQSSLEPDARAYRNDKPIYHPSRPDSEKQFQPQEPEKSYMSSQKPFMQSEKPFMQSEKPFLQNEKAHLQSEKPFVPPEKSHIPNEKAGSAPPFNSRASSEEKPTLFPLRPEAKQPPIPYVGDKGYARDPPPPTSYQSPPPPPPAAPVPFYPGYPPPYGPNPFTAAAVSRSSFYPPPPTYYPPFPTYPQHPPPP